MIMQFLNKLDIYCLIIFTRFNLFLSCFVLLLLLLLGYFIYMQLTLCFMVYFFSVFSFYARSSIECFSAYNYYNTQGQDKLFLFFLSKELSSQCLHPFQKWTDISKSILTDIRVLIVIEKVTECAMPEWN